MAEFNPNPSRHFYDALAGILLSGIEGTTRDRDGTFYYNSDTVHGPLFRLGDQCQSYLVDPPENTEAQKDVLKKGLSIIEVQIAHTAMGSCGNSEYIVARPDVISPNSLIRVARKNIEKELGRDQGTESLSSHVVYNFEEGIIRDPLEHDVLRAVYERVTSILGSREPEQS